MNRFVISWRAPGRERYFFRGDSRYEIFLPYISAEVVSQGWVKDIAHARVFDAFPVFTRTSFAKNFMEGYLRVFPYTAELLPTQIFRPMQRPRPRGPWPPSY